MHTGQIERFMKKISPKLEFNVFAANHLPIRVHLPIYLISNLDPDSKPGSHWVAIYISSNGIGEYFDSFGRKPTGFHEHFLKRNSKMYYYNGTILQNYLTRVCGMYCLVFLYYRFKNLSMYNFVNMFSDSTICNDIILRQLFKTVFYK